MLQTGSGRSSINTGSRMCFVRFTDNDTLPHAVGDVTSPAALKTCQTSLTSFSSRRAKNSPAVAAANWVGGKKKKRSHILSLKRIRGERSLWVCGGPFSMERPR